ncbi:MAG: helix-turn-helix domain-containing protein [Archaeoglobaceae archaeon]
MDLESECEKHLKCTIKCAFDIGCFDMEVYSLLLKKNPLTVDELADALGKDKSTVYKSLQKLLEKGIVERDFRILKAGGYRYLYKPIPFSEFKQKMVKAVDFWTKSLFEYLQKLEKIEKEKLEELLFVKD